MTTITPPRAEGLSGSCCGLRPRDRILGTARELFHRYGYKGVGVDTIAEAAGTNKMTLYRHFGSKDDLIVECLQRFAEEAGALWAGLEERHPGDPVAQLHAWVRAGAECAIADARGCDMVNAAVELTEPDHPARRVIEEFKTAQRDRLVRLCRAAGATQAELLADTLWLLLEGARVSRQSVGAEGPSARFIRMAEAIIAAFLPRGPASP
ncbi:TetR/AcrR family transcriptional regulator [Inquilinus limosus]|uniref:TetR/AcrR family transcriptional regulator n=1 Tax=Inquilinus limosus TaxID=171674 RepID=UPI00040BF69A|nr:TetR/AcrR family transcriptional regulator [Inquilinus limosus]